MNALLFLISFPVYTRGKRIATALCLLALGAGLQVQAQSFDFGDAPDSYGTRLSSNGPRHAGPSSVYLGGTLGSFYDTEPDGQPGSLADGDDTHDQNGTVVANRSDEDGMVPSAICVSRDAYTLRVRVYNNSGRDATVSAWIDFNKNGIFDASERAQTVVPTTPNLSHYNGTDVALTWKDLSALTEGWTYARLRVAGNAAEVANPTGSASSGEVEDYRVHLKDEYDFGDAPKSYGTMMKDNGPCHLINDNQMVLGSLDCSAEDDGKFSELADGDAGEMAVGFPYRLTTAKTTFRVNVNVLNSSGADAMLSGWIDFNRNGLFDANERAQAVVASDTRNLVLSWSGLSGLTEGRTYARFRVACKAGEVASPTGIARSGAVEDYTLMIEPPQYDYGDAPDSYGTRLSSNGPRHIYNDMGTSLCLSNGGIANNIDVEADGQPSGQANGDDALSTNFFGPPFMFNDETGLRQPPVLTTNSLSCSAVLSVRNNTGMAATLSGWIDFNRNGGFDANERAQATIPHRSDAGVVQVELHWTILNALTGGQTFGRFRLASNAAEVGIPTGVAGDGEVEDYGLTIAPTSLPVKLLSFQGRWVEDKGNQLTWASAWETNNDHFAIQRSSDAKSFETIGRVAGHGTASTTQSYAFMDEQDRPADVLYYRLKQVDVDGSVTYSPIISIRQAVETELSMVVYPNPATDQLRLRLPPNQQVRGVRVYSISGTQVINQAGAFDLVDVRSLPAGVYLIEVGTVAGRVLRQRFVKR